MTMRRIVVLALVAPFAIVFWPIWAAQDLIAALRHGYRCTRLP